MWFRHHRMSIDAFYRMMLHFSAACVWKDDLLERRQSKIVTKTVWSVQDTSTLDLLKGTFFRARTCRAATVLIMPNGPYIYVPLAHAGMYIYVDTIPYITLSRDRRRRPRHRRHRRSHRRRCRPGHVAMSSPCRRHVVAMSSPCRRHVVAMWSPCRRHVVAMPSPSRRHVVAVSSPCRRNALAMLSPCHGHVVVMPSPFAPTKLATDPLVHTRNLCPQASRI